MVYRLSILGVFLIEYGLSLWLHVHYGTYNVLFGYKINDGKVFLLWIISLGFSSMVLGIMYSVKHRGE